jgi:hypothetical protein
VTESIMTPSGSAAPPVRWESPSHSSLEAPQTWATPRRARTLSAAVAISIALVRVVSYLLTTGVEFDRFVLGHTWMLIGPVVVCPLGWWLGPAAVATSRRRAFGASIAMALLAMCLGAFGVGIWASVVTATGGSGDPLLSVATGIALAILGIIFVGWFVVLFVTGPSALAWLVVLRVIGWVASRGGSRREGFQS